MCTKKKQTAMATTISRERYMNAGYDYARLRAVVPSSEMPSDVVQFVGELDDIDCLTDVCAHCRPRMTSPISTFVVYGVLDPMLYELRRNVAPIVASKEVFDLLMTTLHDVPHARDVEHMACALVPVVEHAFAVLQMDELDRPFQLLRALAEKPVEISDMIRSVTLLRRVARAAVRRSYRPYAYDVVERAKLYDDPRLVDDLVRSTLWSLTKAWIDVLDPHTERSIGFAETCMAHTPNARDTYIEETIGLWRTGWNPRFGTLLVHQLDTPSVEFVVRLEQKNKLCQLVRTSNDAEHSDLSWRAVRAHLSRHWPERVAEVLNQPVPTTPLTTDHCCPITHAPMVAPVVASDGHTYERDALLRHLVRNGNRSPMTRSPLSYHLYANRALLASQ